MFISAIPIEGHETCSPKKLPFLEEPLQLHADMQVCLLGSCLVTAPEVYDYYAQMLADYNIRVISGITPLWGNAFADTAYNVAVAGRFIIHDLNRTDPILLELAKENGYTPIFTRQRYAKCATCVIPGGIITSDPGIYKAVADYMDALLITPGFVQLPGYPYGFLGGATGMFQNHILLCTGDLSKHPDFEKIFVFLKEHQVTLKSLSNDIPVDIGSIFYVE